VLQHDKKHKALTLFTLNTRYYP